MRKRTSIAKKLTWLNVATTSAALLIMAAVLLIYDHATSKQLLVDNVSAQSDVVGRNSVSALLFNDPESATQTLSALERVPNVRAAALFSPDGQRFAAYTRDQRFTINAVPGERRGGSFEEFQDDELLLTRPVTSGDRIAGYLVIRSDTTSLEERTRRYLIIVGVVLALALLAALLMSSALRRAVAQPVIDLAETARRVSESRDYGVRVRQLGTNDELAVLVDAFNDMLLGIHGRDIALEEERARLSAILDTAPVGILVVDPRDQRIVIANQAINDLLHESAAQGQSYSHWHLLRPNGEDIPQEERPLSRALRGESTPPQELIVIRSDGSRAWVRATAAPVRERQGEITAALLVVASIDDQKKAQEALLLSERLAAAGRLAASVSHEINNPLASVTNLIYLSLNEPTASPEVKELLVQADRELKRVSHIANQTLQFYRQSSSPSQCDIGSIVDSILTMLGSKVHNSGATIERDYRAKEKFTCFEGEMRQVFTNLVTNALDAAPRLNGRLLIRTKSVHKGEGAGVQITIADNGHGIPADTLPHIFDPFYTTKGTRGTGLGLWVSKEIISKHHGTIRVRSRAGKGSVFVVTLPYRSLADAAVQKTQSA